VHDATTETPETGLEPVRKQKQTPQHLSEGPPQTLHDTTGGANDRRNFGKSACERGSE
jgi:hypothetical protein